MRPKASMAATRVGHAAAFGRLEDRGLHNSFFTIRHRSHQQRRPRGIELRQLLGQGLVGFLARYFAGSAQRDLKEGLVGSAQLLDEQTDAVVLAGHNGSARCFEQSLLRQVGSANGVVHGDCITSAPVSQRPFRAKNASFAHG